MKDKLYSVVFMFVITLGFTALVSGVKAMNETRIIANERAKLQRVVLDVLRINSEKGLPAEDVTRLFRERVETSVVGERTVYTGLNPNGEITGYAFTVTGAGFWGPITGMVALDAGLDRILGVNFYHHSETPGLGARMTESWFRDQFKDLALRTGRDGTFFHLVPAGTGTSPEELDAITGATQTSQALDRFMNREIEAFARSMTAAKKGTS